MPGTEELEKKIKDSILKVLPDLQLTQVFFSEACDNSPEGTYIYAENGKYYLAYTEKGRIREKKEADTEREVLWHLLDGILFNLAMEYAVNNRISGEDFRRVLFSKEIELYAKFGRDFEERKKAEIEAVLNEYPYHDGE